MPVAYSVLNLGFKSMLESLKKTLSVIVSLLLIMFIGLNLVRIALFLLDRVQLG